MDHSDRIHTKQVDGEHSQKIIDYSTYIYIIQYMYKIDRIQ